MGVINFLVYQTVMLMTLIFQHAIAKEVDESKGGEVKTNSLHVPPLMGAFPSELVQRIIV